MSEVTLRKVETSRERESKIQGLYERRYDVQNRLATNEFLYPSGWSLEGLVGLVSSNRTDRNEKYSFRFDNDS